MRRTAMTWSDVLAYLRQQPSHACAGVRKWEVEHPQAAGLRRSLGLPVGQLADWRMLGCGHGLHVREYADRYTAHIDHVNPNCDLPGHVVSDAPKVAGGAALGALLGLALGESPRAMMLGALIGGALGASAAASDEAAKCSAPATRRPRHGRA